MKKKLVFCLLLVSGSLSANETRRIVTVGAIASELVCTLGACGEIVATDVTSVYPPELAGKPKVGYITRLSVEGILSLKPTHLVVVDGAGPNVVIERLAESGIAITTLPTGLGLADAKRRLLLVGKFTGRKKRATTLAQKLDQELAALSGEKVANKPAKVLFLYARGAQTLLAMGRDTTADEIIRLAGAENAFAAEGAKPVNAEAIAAAAPEIVIVPEGSLLSIGGRAALARIPGLADAPAVRQNRILTIDDSLLAGLGPRSAAAVRALRQKIQKAMQER